MNKMFWVGFDFFFSRTTDRRAKNIRYCVDGNACRASNGFPSDAVDCLLVQFDFYAQCCLDRGSNKLYHNTPLALNCIESIFDLI